MTCPATNHWTGTASRARFATSCALGEGVGATTKNRCSGFCSGFVVGKTPAKSTPCPNPLHYYKKSGPLCACACAHAHAHTRDDEYSCSSVVDSIQVIDNKEEIPTTKATTSRAFCSGRKRGDFACPRLIICSSEWRPAARNGWKRHTRRGSRSTCCPPIRRRRWKPRRRRGCAAEAVLPYVHGKVDNPAPAQMGVLITTAPAMARARWITRRKGLLRSTGPAADAG